MARSTSRVNSRHFKEASSATFSEKKLLFNIFVDNEFFRTHQALSAKRKSLFQSGFGNEPNATRELTEEEQEKLFETMQFDDHGKKKQGKAAVKLATDDLSLQSSSLQVMADARWNSTKRWRNTGLMKWRNQTKSWWPDLEYAFATRQKSTGKFLSDAVSAAGLQSGKIKLSNPSVTKTSICRLIDANFPENYEMQLSDHKFKRIQIGIFKPPTPDVRCTQQTKTASDIKPYPDKSGWFCQGSFCIEYSEHWDLRKFFISVNFKHTWSHLCWC